MNQLTKITLVWELFELGLTKVDIADKLQVNRDTIRVWASAIEELGLLEFLDRYSKAKRVKR